MKYHDITTNRERLAKLFYRLPIMPTVSLEKFVALKLIPFVEGKNPHSIHLGKNCPCWREN